MRYLPIVLLCASALTARAAAPAPDLQRAIDAFVGTWSISEDYLPHPEFPNGLKGHGTEIWRAGPGNLSLIYEYQSDARPGGTAAAAILWWDGKIKGFRELWCFSRSDEGCRISTATIQWLGDEWVFTDSYVTEGKRIFTREVWSAIRPDAHTMTMSTGQSPKALEPWLISHAVRAK